MPTVETAPQFVIPKRSADEWGEYFLETAQLILATRGGNSVGRGIEDAIRSAAALTEALVELSEKQE